MTVRSDTLSNGFQVVTEHMPGLASASLGIWVQAGGRHERLEQNGMAHFLEHMAFKGTRTRSSLQIAQSIEDVGGYLNAYTSRETTAFYARVLADDVPLALDVIADILLNPVFDPAEIEVERGVILQEIGQAHDTPDDVIFDWLQEQAYPDQPIGRTILGPQERVRQFQRNDFVDFVSQHYGPERMILAAAGDVDHDALLRDAERLFGEKSTGPKKQELQPARYQGGENRVVKDLEQAHFALAFEGPNYRDPAIYTAQIYASILGGGMSSRLFQEVREHRGLCYTIFAQAGAYADTGLTTIYAGTSGEQVGELAGLVMDEIKRSVDSIDEAELSRARAQMKAGMLMGLESPGNRAERLARMQGIWGRIPDLNETVEHIDAVSLRDISAFAEGLASGAMPTMTLYGPVEDAPDLSVLTKRLST